MSSPAPWPSRGWATRSRDFNLINSLKADLTFDQTWPVSDMVNLVLDFHSVDINSVPQLTLPVQVVTDPEGGGGLVYEGSNYGDVEFPAEAQDLASIDQLLGIGPTTDSHDRQPAALRRASVSVSVLNGTGVDNQAADTATALTALGYHVVGVGDTAPVGDVSETTSTTARETPRPRPRRSRSSARCRVPSSWRTTLQRWSTAHRSPWSPALNSRSTLRRRRHRRRALGHGLDITEHDDDVDDFRARRVWRCCRSDLGAQSPHDQSRAVGPPSLRAGRGGGGSDSQPDVTCPPSLADS